MALRLSRNDMYSGGEIIVLPDGTEILERDLSIQSQSSGDSFKIMQEGELLHRIAYDFWDPKLGQESAGYWWVIADNMEGIENPLDLNQFTGQQIRIPDIARFIAEA